MTKEKQELPKWFNGEVYSEGGEVRNPHSGESYELTAEELSMYDFIKGVEIYTSVIGMNEEHVEHMQKGLSWFRQTNPKAYMVLLD